MLVSETAADAGPGAGVRASSRWCFVAVGPRSTAHEAILRHNATARDIVCMADRNR